MSDSTKDAPEPSMEEILSSIRRIIAEEDETTPARPVGATAASPQPFGQDGGDDVLVLTDRIDNGPRPAEPLPEQQGGPLAPQHAPAEPSVLAVETAPEPDPPRRQEPSVHEPSPLVSTSVAAASAAAFSKLARAAAPAANEPPLPISGMTVEQLLMSMLEPMLKDWFEKNLPAVVERIVEEEVKKLVRRAELQ